MAIFPTDPTGRREEKIPSGYEGQNIPTDFYIPPCTISDIDNALLNLFKTKLKFYSKVDNETKKTPILFAAGERFATIQHKLPLKGRDGTNILPMIAIKRSGINQNVPGRGRGIGTNTGDLVISRRLSPTDKNYQKLINKYNILNQDNIASTANIDLSLSGSVAGRLASRRPEALSLINQNEGQILSPKLANNIFEFITVPWPQFIQVNYEIIFWTQYMETMNEMLEQVLTSYDGQGNNFKLTTDKGYYFIAYVLDEFRPQDNASDFSNQERIVKYSFNIEVTGYLVANQGDSQQNPFRYFLSAPQISFGIVDVDKSIVTPFNGPLTGDFSKFTLSDVTNLDKRGEELLVRGDQETSLVDIVQDPFNSVEEVRYLKVTNRNTSGETTYKEIDIDTIV